MSDSPVYKALAAAQAEMPRLRADSENPHFKSRYADLATVQETALPALHKHGFAVFHQVGEGGATVDTVLAHSSGERIVCSVPLKVDKSNMQGLGSAITYARRYGLMMLAGLAPDDDDGNAAAAAPPKKQKSEAQEKRDQIKGIRDILGKLDDKYHQDNDPAWTAFVAWVNEALPASLTDGAQLGSLTLEEIERLQEYAEAWRTQKTF